MIYYFYGYHTMELHVKFNKMEKKKEEKSQRGWQLKQQG